MLASILSRQIVTKLQPCCQHQQVRFVKKTIRIRYAYGRPPILNDEEYQAAKDEGQLERLAFERVRMALPYENCSPLYDTEYEKFVRYAMKGGKKGLTHSLMSDAFYHIKSIQFRKLRKQNENKPKEADKEKANPSGGAKLEEEEEETIETNPMVIFKKALVNSEPVVVTKKVKRGGATYQVPFPLTSKQSNYLATKWLIKAVTDRPRPRKKLFGPAMAQELLDAYYNRGQIVKRRDDIHKLADANRAYAHYRWG